MRALLALSRERGIWIIADEVYGRLYFDGDVAPSMLQLAEPDDLVMCVNSFSKAWAMTGFRLGWLVHPASLADRVGAMTQYLNSGTADFIQEAGTAAITQGEGLVAEIRERCRHGVALAHERLGAIDRVRLTKPPRGGMYAFFRIDGMPDARAACLQVLERARVGLAPGELFGDAAAGLDPDVRLPRCRRSWRRPWGGWARHWRDGFPGEDCDTMPLEPHEELKLAWEIAVMDMQIGQRPARHREDPAGHRQDPLWTSTRPEQTWLWTSKRLKTQKWGTMAA